MGLSYQALKTTRQWRSSTGLDGAQFVVLCGHFAQAYESVYGQSLAERKGNSSREAVFRSYEELLFFILFSLKSGVTYDVLGLIFGCDMATAQRNQKENLPILRAALAAAGVMPARAFKTVQEFEDYFSNRVDAI